MIYYHNKKNLNPLPSIMSNLKESMIFCTVGV
jgi:hypothetical protein